MRKSGQITVFLSLVQRLSPGGVGTVPAFPAGIRRGGGTGQYVAEIYGAVYGRTRLVSGSHKVRCC